jgi:hypothetical protein
VKASFVAGDSAHESPRKLPRAETMSKWASNDLLHIRKLFSAHGVNDLVICCG